MPGISVAVAKDGELVYLGGAGDQDVADDVWMHSGSVGRIASVSKAVAGVLAMRLDAEHASLSMSDLVREHLPELPPTTRYTVAQTLMNRSCVDHYPDGHSSQNQTHYDSAWRWSRSSWTSRSPARRASTSTARHAYDVRRGAEGLEGKSADRIALDELTTPFGLTTLRTENLAGPLADRMTLYTTSNAEYAGDDTSNKWYGGGFVSSARDLTRFGMGILDGTILTETSARRCGRRSAAMRTAGTSAGRRRPARVGKAGGQPGSNAYLRIYPDDGIVISVLSNRQGGGHSARLLSRAIGEVMGL